MSIEWLIAILSGLFLLVLGSYGFTWAVFTVLLGKIDEIMTNHILHMQKDIDEIRRRLRL